MLSKVIQTRLCPQVLNWDASLRWLVGWAGLVTAQYIWLLVLSVMAELSGQSSQLNGPADRLTLTSSDHLGSYLATISFTDYFSISSQILEKSWEDCFQICSFITLTKPNPVQQWSDAILHPTYCGWLDTEHDRQPPGSMSGLKATKDCMNQAGCWLEEKWSAADILHGVMSLLRRALLHSRLLPRATPWWQLFAEIYS